MDTECATARTPIYEQQSTPRRAPVSGRRAGRQRTRLKSCSGWQMVVHASHSRAKNRRLPARRHARQTATASNSCAARGTSRGLAGRHTKGCSVHTAQHERRPPRAALAWPHKAAHAVSSAEPRALPSARKSAVVLRARRIGIYVRRPSQAWPTSRQGVATGPGRLNTKDPPPPGPSRASCATGCQVGHPQQAARRDRCQRQARRKAECHAARHA